MNLYYVSSDPIVFSEHQEKLKSYGDIHLIKTQKLNGNELINKIRDVNILVAAPSGIKSITKKVLQSLPDLKFITTTTTGADWIDLLEAKRLGIVVSTCKGANAESVAEHTWGMILDLSKRITEFDRAARKGAYDFSQFSGREVFGKTLGILGLGDIGTKVARIANSFNMTVLGYNRSNKSIDGLRQTSLEMLFSKSDIISIHLPLTAQTRNIVNTESIKMMKEGVIIVNTAREEIMDKVAILDGIRSKKISGLGIETEIMKPIKEDDPYFQYSNIIVNPHNGFNTVEADKRVKATWVANIQAFIEGYPQNVVST